MDETLSSLTNQCRANLKNLILGQLIDRCNETIHSVQDIPRMYRKTHREVSYKRLKGRQENVDEIKHKKEIFTRTNIGL